MINNSANLLDTNTFTTATTFTTLLIHHQKKTCKNNHRKTKYPLREEVCKGRNLGGILQQKDVVWRKKNRNSGVARQ